MGFTSRWFAIVAGPGRRDVPSRVFMRPGPLDIKNLARYAEINPIPIFDFRNKLR
jgi:hypothetical protein